MEKYNNVYKHFQDMEKRYHTWMNYYAIFNGALLVAYTSDISNSCLNSVLNCRVYILLISILGIITSYCWYLSSIGHHAWLGDWRMKLQELNPYIDKTISKKIEKCDYSICGHPVLPFYLSTNYITNVFILCVLFSWIFVFVFNISTQLKFSKLAVVCGSLFIWILLIILVRIMHKFLGSSLAGFEQGNMRLTQKETVFVQVCENKYDILLMIALGLFIICLCEIL